MKSMIFMCLSLVIMAGIARVYMAGGLDGILGGSSGSENFRAKAPKNVKAVTTDQDIDVYKWRDKNGIMHFGSVPPAQMSGVEIIQLRTNVNTMKAVAVSNNVPVVNNSEIIQHDISNPYSPQGMNDLINKAKDLTDTLNRQQADQKKMLDDL